MGFRVRRYLDGARVLYHTVVDLHKDLGAGLRRKDNKEVPVAFLAICQYSGDSSFYLFAVSRDNEVLADYLDYSINETMETAKGIYGVDNEDWVQAKSG